MIADTSISSKSVRSGSSQGRLNFELNSESIASFSSVASPALSVMACMTKSCNQLHKEGLWLRSI